MKNSRLLAFTVIIISLILSSCISSDKVTTSNFIQKRKYNKGYYANLFSKNSKFINKENTRDSIKIDPAELTSTTEKTSENIGYNNETDNETNSLIASNNNIIKENLNQVNSRQQSDFKNTIPIFNNNKEILKKNNIRKLISPLPYSVKIPGRHVDPLAILSLLFSLISFALSFVVGGSLGGIICGGVALAAFILGIASLVKISKNSESYSGKALAIAGMVIGGFMIIISLLAIYAWVHMF